MKKLTVIKVGGKIVEEAGSLQSLLDSFANVDGAKVLVHGGGRTATAVAETLGIESVMVEGRRVTDESMLRVVTMVYGGLVNKNIVASLQARGINSIGLTGADMDIVRSTRRPPVAMSDGAIVDFGFVGDVKTVDGKALSTLIEEGCVPVVAPITHDGKGNLLNTNADTMAQSVASGLAALLDAFGKPLYDVTLTFCFEKPGVLSDPDNDNSVIPFINREEFDRLKADGTVSGGMIPKLTNAFVAIDSGISRVVITCPEALDKGTVITK